METKDKTQELEDGRVQVTESGISGDAIEIVGERTSLKTSETFYTPKEDVLETYEDGKVIILAHKNVPIPMADARSLGLVKDSQKVGPTETKPANVITETKKIIKKSSK